ncbi:hypothetical protein [Teichococcus vastitatis]|uniref:Uncharacterized protein n=1 Tax=Teichococcus vastitatis TaxID=2307076 RepID=A0ABS9W1C7_9PROT|nr:hypothetical protein [Pseudoroseomonas vastitatis]MCI0753104.1 hypothetical protein [Pseudoroseomonas vastitatis]
MRRFLASITLAATLTLAGCQNPDGTTDWGSTLALGAGAGLAAGLIAGSVGDDDNRGYRRHRHRRYDGGYRYGHGYGHGRHYHSRPYRHRGYGW